MTLTECIDEYVEKAPLEKPLTTDDIYDYILSKLPEVKRACFNVALQRYEKGNDDFARYQKGIYYKRAETPFGKTGIDLGALFQKDYIFEGEEIVGYERGPSLMNRIGLTTQMPTYLYVATMKTNRTKIDKRYGAYLTKPVTAVTKENCHYLQFLDLLENKENVHIDVEDQGPILERLLKEYELSFPRLLSYASFYDDIKIYRGLASLARGLT